MFICTLNKFPVKIFTRYAIIQYDFNEVHILMQTPTGLDPFDRIYYLTFIFAIRDGLSRIEEDF